MELLDSKTRQDADLGGTFISEKEVTLKLNGQDLSKLFNLNIENVDEEHYEILNDLVDILLEGVTSYDLV